MQVELLVFSGRENPTWVIEAQVSLDLAALLHALPLARPFDTPQVLGYSGMIVSDGTEEVFVYHELVSVRRKATNYFVDADRKVENFLLETAKGHVEDAVLAQIKLGA